MSFEQAVSFGTNGTIGPLLYSMAVNDCRAVRLVTWTVSSCISGVP